MRSSAIVRSLFYPILCLWVGLCIGAAALADTRAVDDFESILERYVREGLRSNLALRAETIEVEKAAAALAEARARFRPQVTLEARYTRADGGREFLLPFGQALNPIHGTLNEMLAAQGRPAAFPEVEDETVRLLRREEQDTRLVVRQPLYAPTLSAAIRAQRAFLDAGNYRRMAIARTLRRDISLAYIDWLRARNAVEVYIASEALLGENLRVNQSLFDNGKITEDQVLRARAELLEVRQQRRQAEDLVTHAQRYLNFLLNRELRAPLEAAPAPDTLDERAEAVEKLWAQALTRRPEVFQLQELREASAHQMEVARRQKWPTLTLALDAGTQGEEYALGKGHNFGMVSLVFTWRVFDGGGDDARARQARAAERQLVLRQEEMAQQIRLEVQQSWDALATARDSLATAAARVEAARAAFRIASRKRDAGAINQAEFIDARSALTRAELNYTITRFDVLARRAELEYAVCAGDLPLDPGA